MELTGFIGPSYESQSKTADCQLCQNWYPELIESLTGKSRMALYPRPGITLHSTLDQTPGRGIFPASNGRCFAVSGAEFYEVKANGTNTPIGAVVNDGKMASFADNGLQLLVASGGTLYLFTFATSAFAVIPDPVGVSLVAYSDGYFIAQLASSDIFRLSGLLDGTTWNPLLAEQVSVFPGNVLTMIVNQRLPWFLGAKNGSAYENVGSATIPFDPIPGSETQVGSAAVYGSCLTKDGFCFVGAGPNGRGVGYMVIGSSRQQVSNHAIELAWQTYTTIADAVSFAIELAGHEWWVIYFPTGNATWAYDITESQRFGRPLWHQWSYLNPVNGSNDAHLANSHAYAFDKHLITDRQSGKVYRMDIPQRAGSTWTFCDDNSSAISRIRRSPHVAKENQYLFIARFWLDIQAGIGPIPALLDGAGDPRSPQISLRTSINGGFTWGNYLTRDIGRAGQYNTQVYWNRLGRGRDWVLEISGSDAVPYNIVNGYLT